MKIGNFKLDEGKAFIIAELSANHNGSLENAVKTIKAAKRAGADAIKLQTYTADTITIDAPQDDFKITQGTIWDGKRLYDLYEEAHTPWEWHSELFRVAKEENLICFSSPFDITAVDFLEDLDVPAYKIASFEITDIPLIKYVASKKKPIIISTGIAEEKDISLAVEACHSEENHAVILLKCTSSYPAPIDQANLSMIQFLADKYNTLSGLSDHTLGVLAPIVAVSLGAKVIEKHFILDKSIGGPDASFSLDEEEFAQMVRSVREAEQAIGSVNFQLSAKQIKSREHSRSLYIVKDMEKGERLNSKNVKSIRPGFGLHPKFLTEILGKKVNRSVNKGERLSWNLIETE